jgi:phage terminase small subunit
VKKLYALVRSHDHDGARKSIRDLSHSRRALRRRAPAWLGEGAIVEIHRVSRTDENGANSYIELHERTDRC